MGFGFTCGLCLGYQHVSLGRGTRWFPRCIVWDPSSEWIVLLMGCSLPDDSKATYGRGSPPSILPVSLSLRHRQNGILRIMHTRMHARTHTHGIDFLART